MEDMSEMDGEGHNYNSNNVSKMTYDINFKPQHWSDASVFYNLHSEVDLEAQIDKAFIKATKYVRKSSQLTTPKASESTHEEEDQEDTN